MHKTRKSIDQQQLASLNLKVLTIWQPFASLIAFGEKRFETRPKPTSHIRDNNWYLIHAAKKWDNEIKDICLSEPFFSTLKDIGYPNTLTSHYGGLQALEGVIFPLGQIVALCQVKRCLKSTGYKTHEGETWVTIRNENHPIMSIEGNELAFGNYNEGRYAWELINVHMVEPFLYQGSQGYYASFKGNTNQIKIIPS